MKNQKKILALAGIGLILVGVAAIVFKLVRKPEQADEPILTVKPTPAAAKLLTYEDEAGFNFEYPEGLEIEDISSESDYSLLKITSDIAKGETTIHVVDTKDTLEKHISKYQVSQGFSNREVDLAGMEARQGQLGEENNLVTFAIDKGVLFEIKSPIDQAEDRYWNKIHNTIVASFSLGEAKTQTGGQTTGSGDAIYEEEEIVE